MVRRVAAKHPHLPEAAARGFDLDAPNPVRRRLDGSENDR
jgi:hypothetical protein